MPSSTVPNQLICIQITNPISTLELLKPSNVVKPDKRELGMNLENESTIKSTTTSYVSSRQHQLQVCSGLELYLNGSQLHGMHDGEHSSN